MSGRADRDAVIFDLGGVVLGWDPRRAFAGVLPDEAVAAFLDRIDFRAWNHGHDAGRPFADGEAELLARFPDDAAAVRAYRRNFAATLTGLVPGTSAVLAELQRAGVRRVALTNWSAETFPYARERFGILDRFEGIVVSGTERLAKPDPALFRLALDRFGLDPERTVFVDDSAANVTAARSLGLHGVLFRAADTFRAELVGLGLPGPPDEPAEPVFHLAPAADWAAAESSGHYPWSTRGIGYEAEGYVHCSFAHQVDGVRRRYYTDLADDEVVLLELRTGAGPLVVEDLGAGQAFPHLYAELTPALVSSCLRPPSPAPLRPSPG